MRAPKCSLVQGDVNGDDLLDWAVGAPNEDDGLGAVFIYHGARRGAFAKEPKPAQVWTFP